MAVGSNLGASFGMVAETVYGTYLAVTRHYRARSATVKPKKVTVQGGGMGAGASAQPTDLRVMTAKAAEGAVMLDFLDAKMGPVLAQIFGTAPAPAQQAATTAYKQAFTVADIFGRSMGAQLGIPNRGGTVVPFSGTGGKVTAAEFVCQRNDVLTVALTIDFQAESEGQAFASTTFIAGPKPFHFGQLAVKVGAFGAEVAAGGVKGVNLKIERPMSVEDYYAKAANAGVAVKDEPIWNGFLAVSGTIDVDFVDKTVFHDRFTGDTPASLVIEWVGANIASTYFKTLRFTMPGSFFEDGYGVVDGTDVNSASIPFTAMLDLTNGQILCDYITTDVTA